MISKRGRVKIAGSIDLAIDDYARECRIVFHIDVNAVRAIEQHVDNIIGCANDVGLEIRGGTVARGLRLPRHNLARGILGYCLEHLTGKEHDARFENRKQQREENRGDQREFDGSRTPAITSESAKDVCCSGC